MEKWVEGKNLLDNSAELLDCQMMTYRAEGKFVTLNTLIQHQNTARIATDLIIGIMQRDETPQ